MLFSGFLANIESILPWLAWVKYFSILRYGINALTVNEMTGRDTNTLATANNSTEAETRKAIELALMAVLKRVRRKKKNAPASCLNPIMKYMMQVNMKLGMN